MRDGNLTEFQRAVGLTQQANQITHLRNIARLLGIGAQTVGVQIRTRPLHAGPIDGFFLLAIAGQNAQTGLVDLGDDGRFQAVDRALFGQLLRPASAGHARKAAFRPAIAVALIVVDQALLDGLVGVLLQVARHRGRDAEALCIGLAAITADHFGAGHFSDVRRVHFRCRYVITGVERLV